MKRRALMMVTVGALVFASACDKKDDKPAGSDKPADTASASSAAMNTTPPPTPASANAKPFTVQADGKLSVDMPAPNEHIKASATNSAGELSIDPANLAATRGEVKVDLTTLKTATFDDAKKNASQTEHAQNWLEVGTLVTPEEREKNKYVIYTIHSVSNLSATDLSKVTPTKDGAEDVRTVTAKTQGELTLHGKKSNREVTVSVSFRGPPDKPTRVDVKSVEPLKIVLAQHDVKPRDNFGKIAQASFHLLGTKVADDAAVSLEINAKPK